MSKVAWFLALGTLGAFIAGCTLDSNSLSGVIGDRNAQLLGAAFQAGNAVALSEKDEDTIGQSVAAAITSQHPPVPNTNLQIYVDNVGFTIANATPKADGNWVFGVIDSPEVNAFSGPNGYVLITRGALLQMHDEAELAGVLAHEAAHVCNHDGLAQVKAAELKGALVNSMKAADSRLAQLAVLADSGLDVVTRTGYSQPQEFKADEDAVRIMYSAGYDPNSYLNFLRRLESLGTTGGGQVMSTHPGIAERVARVDAAIRALPRTPGQKSMGATLAARFMYNMQQYGGGLTPGLPAAPGAPLQPAYPATPAQPVYQPGLPPYPAARP